MKKLILLGAAALALTAGTALTSAAHAQSADGFSAGNLLVRLRAADVIPLNVGSSTSIDGKVGGTSSLIPELDFSYYFTDNLAAELILGTSLHNISVYDTKLGDVAVSKVWVLPPTVTLQYHPFPKAAISPYVGAGLNVTFFYGVQKESGFNSVTYSNAVGPALQAGVDFALGGNFYGNIDVKQIFISTRASVNQGAVTAKTGLDPLVVGAGVGYKF